MASANQQLADALVRYAVGLERLSDATVRRVIAGLRRADARIVERLASGYEPQSSRRQQEALLGQIRAILDSVYTDELGRLRIDLDDLAVYEAEAVKDAFDKVLPNLGYRLTSPDQLHAAVYSRPFQGRLMKDWFSDLPEAAFKRMEREIRQGFIEGRTNAQIIRAIQGTRAQGYKDGIAQVNRRDAEVTVRTAIAHVSNAARERSFRSNRKVLRGVQWVSVLDKRTSLICAGRDGKIYEVDKGPRPPAHPRCRSTTVPVVKSRRQISSEKFSELELSKLDGNTAEEMTYGAWLRRQNVAAQEEVLGVTKARLFRAGELPIDKFTNATGEEYTLDQLRQRNREAWDKAGLD